MKKIIAVIIMLLIGCNVYAADFGNEDSTYIVLRRHNFFETNTEDWIRSNNHIAGQIQGCATKYGTRTDADNDFFIKKNSAVKDAYISTKIYVEESGTYYIWVNTDNKPDGGNRSGYLWFDDSALPSEAYNFNNAQTASAKLEDSGWYWDRDNGTELEAGWHTLYMAADNANFRVALVVVTDDADEDLLNLSVSENYATMLEPLTDIQKPVIESFNGLSRDFASLKLNLLASDNNTVSGYDIYINDEYTKTISAAEAQEYAIEGFFPLQQVTVRAVAYDLNGNKAESEIKTFNISPVEVTNLTIMTDDEIVINDKSQISAGMNLEFSITLKSNSEALQMLLPGVALYSNETGRMSAYDRESGSVDSGGEKTFKLTLSVPEDFVAEDKLLITVWDSADTIMPLISSIAW